MKKILSPVIALVLALALVACGSQQPTVSADQGSGQYTQSGGQGGNSGPGSNLNSRLAMGILELEGTSNAVTADQAKQLLPLFQQLQSDMSNFDGGNRGPNGGSNATPAATQETGSNNTTDLQSLYQQIEGILTSDQVSAIENLDLSQSDIQNLMQQYNIQYTPNAGSNGGNFPTQSPDQMSTRQAEQQTRVAANGGTSQPGFSGTPGAGGFAGRGGFGGYDFLFISPVITLLQQRAGS